MACTDGAGVFDLAHGGKALGRIKTGGGVDTLEYDPRARRLFVAAGKDGTLTIARVTDGGALEVEATVPTAKGARNPVADAHGTVYVADSQGGQLLVVSPDALAAGAVAMQEEQPGLLARAQITPDPATASPKEKPSQARPRGAQHQNAPGKPPRPFTSQTPGRK